MYSRLLGFVYRHTVIFTLFFASLFLLALFFVLYPHGFDTNIGSIFLRVNFMQIAECIFLYLLTFDY